MGGARIRITRRGYFYSLAGVGMSYITGASTELYANVSQVYRPIV